MTADEEIEYLKKRVSILEGAILHLLTPNGERDQLDETWEEWVDISMTEANNRALPGYREAAAKAAREGACAVIKGVSRVNVPILPTDPEAEDLVDGLFAAAYKKRKTNERDLIMSDSAERAETEESTIEKSTLEVIKEIEDKLLFLYNIIHVQQGVIKGLRK